MDLSNLFRVGYNQISMKWLLTFFEFTSSIGLVIAILIHAAKGEGLGSVGGSASVFRSNKGLESGLNKVTAILAGIFMLSAGILGVFF